MRETEFSTDTTDPEQIIVGRIVRSTLTLRDDLRHIVFEKGELGVCLAVQQHGEDKAWAVLFQRGKLCMFTRQGVEINIQDDGRTVAHLADYKLSPDTETVTHQWATGLFNAAWSFPEPKLVRSNPSTAQQSSSQHKPPQGVA